MCTIIGPGNFSSFPRGICDKIGLSHNETLLRDESQTWSGRGSRPFGPTYRPIVDSNSRLRYAVYSVLGSKYPYIDVCNIRKGSEHANKWQSFCCRGSRRVGPMCAFIGPGIFCSFHRPSKTYVLRTGPVEWNKPRKNVPSELVELADRSDTNTYL